jgi:hypothetical protein
MLEKLQKFSALAPKPKVLTQSLREVPTLPLNPFELFCSPPPPPLLSFCRPVPTITLTYVQVKKAKQCDPEAKWGISFC